MTSDTMRRDEIERLENAELTAVTQDYGRDPLAKRETGHYRAEYVKTFVEKWDELIDWDARAAGEGDFFIDILRSRGKQKVLDVACGTGFHSVRLTEAGFDVTSVDGNAAMLAKAFENARKRSLILKTTQADWRWLNRDIQGKADAIVCLGNSFTHLFEEMDRRRALAEFYAALKHDGLLIIDQRNYDAILDHGFTTTHKYYYCGRRVSAEPEYFDDGLIRFKYSFPDDSSYTLNMFPLRKNYLRRLLREAGFERVHTYGDFEEDFQDHEPDFLIHVAEKSVVRQVQVRAPQAETGGAGSEIREQTRAVAEDYYDSDDADAFYHRIWGGEDIHIGLYEETDRIKEASRRTIEAMAGRLEGLGRESRVLDIGAGYGGAARLLARTHGCEVSCLNVSETQNDTNRYLNRRQKLNDQVTVVHGTFEDIPERDGSFDVVWSQDAILHSGDREKVFQEALRVLKPGGSFIFTDPMQADDCPEGVLQPVYDRIHLESLGSFGSYRETAEKLGFETVELVELTGNLRTHYARVGEELKANYEELAGLSSRSYLDRMLVGLDNWVKAADQGWLAWGILHFRKPARN
ncbi:glycine/sarcosine N-methyltransferase [Tistlia consotensis]|uniref:Glycine/sarcosine N-methyltransferase n=1 Tax=Tistlia consotensis USBA 355 TaxID=560819 RepID=A0A1Y6CF21_9PROT|nr:methyltransferase domain-containing protein [Tistlia consotensis]SMF51769.1 glycine/sarcosine N-methyltransferase [Tistlia consotensis USBA 355]SNR83762.1 glycine/sarcosine N-methyltransferase [Tistlia consotensis]